MQCSLTFEDVVNGLSSLKFTVIYYRSERLFLYCGAATENGI
jgi:hypothetical protein